MANAVLDAQVAAIHARSKRSYGRPRILKGLCEQGVQVGHERILPITTRWHGYITPVKAESDLVAA